MSFQISSSSFYTSHVTCPAQLSSKIINMPIYVDTGRKVIFSTYHKIQNAADRPGLRTFTVTFQDG